MSRSTSEREAVGGAIERTDNEPRQARAGRLTELADWAKTLAAAFAIVLLVNAFLFNLSTVEGHSMEPTLETREWLLVNKIGYRLGAPERGDVVIVRDPTEGLDRKQYLVKRIVGLPGDTIEVRAGKLYVNGALADEPYTDVEIQDPAYGPLTVGSGSYFLMGDNRRYGASKDSRAFGPVSAAAIQGEAAYIIWPIDKWGKL